MLNGVIELLEYLDYGLQYTKGETNERLTCQC